MQTLLDFAALDFAGNSLARWLLAVAGAGLLLQALLFARRYVARRYDELRRSAELELLEIPFRIAQRTASAFVAVLAVAAGLATLHLNAVQRELLVTVVVIAALWQLGLWLSAALGTWLEHRRRRVLLDDRAAAGSLDIVGFIGRLAIWVVVLLLTLDNLGIDITALIAGLGIGGIAIALAVQNILGDLFASLSITFDKPFVVGDFLIVGDYLGTVENIGIKSTRLRSLSGEQIVIANADLLASRVRNYQRMQERRVLFTIGVTYETPRTKLERIPGLMRAIVESHAELRFERCHFANFGACSLDFETVYHVLSADYIRHMDAQQAVFLALLAAFEREGIEFAYPTQTLHVVDAARSRERRVGSG